MKVKQILTEYRRRYGGQHFADGTASIQVHPSDVLMEIKSHLVQQLKRMSETKINVYSYNDPDIIKMLRLDTEFFLEVAKDVADDYVEELVEKFDETDEGEDLFDDAVKRAISAQMRDPHFKGQLKNAARQMLNMHRKET